MDENDEFVDYDNCLKFTKVYHENDTQFKNPKELKYKDAFNDVYDILIFYINQDKVFFGLDTGFKLLDENGKEIAYSEERLSDYKEDQYFFFLGEMPPKTPSVPSVEEYESY